MIRSAKTEDAVNSPLVQIAARNDCGVATLAGMSLFTAIVRVPASVLLGLIWLYRKTASPVLPIIFGPSCGCRFAPTCSHYAAEAVRTHGALVGSGLAVARLLKCTPLHPGGIDPVPARIQKFSCVSLAKATPAEVR